MSIDPVIEPAPLRHVSRHLQLTITRYLRKALTDMGWVEPEAPAVRTVPVPFSGRAFTFQTGRRSEADMVAIEPNLIAVTFGEEPDPEEQELGGGLVIQQSALVCDIIPANEPIGLAIASDVRDVLTGRYPGYRRFTPLLDYTTAGGVEVPGYQIEFSDVQRRRNDGQDFRLNWQQVIALIELHMPGWE